MSRMRPSVRSWWFASLLLVVLALAPMASAQRVVAVADVHGDYESFISILQAAKLLDAQNRWIGGNAILVQTGDFTDRGPRSREVMDLMMALETEAPKHGGKVIILLGNHEVMNMFGELAYVSEGEYAAFADENSEKRREKAFKEYGKWLRKAMTSAGDRLPEFTLETEGQWKKRRPLGFMEHREAFGPQGKYGKWLRSLNAVAKVGDTLFLHGGISPRLHSSSAEQINKKVHSEIQTFDLVMKDLSYSGLSLPSLFLKELLPVARQQAIETGQPGSLREVAGMDGWWTMSSEGPLWFRGYNTWTEEEGPEYLAKILKAFGVARVVVGHTPQTEGRIRARFDGKVYLIDTGMLQTHYTGQASALEIADADITGIYMDRRVVLNGTKPAVVVPATFQREDKERSARGGGIGSEAVMQDAPAAQAPAAAPAAAPESIWTDVTGNPLPFKSDEELIDFLVNAKVVSSKTLGKGVTAPKKVVLELNGVRAHGVFRDVDEDGPTTMASGIRDAFFRDSYMFEPAAYQLSLLLGTRNVPPAAERKVNGKKGSIQIYIENGMDEQDRIKKKMNPPNPLRYSRQVHMMRVFDNLVYNDDRNQGNIYYDLNWNLWLIDHTRAFRRKTDLKEPHMVMACDRALFEKLKTLDEAATREKLKGLLRGPEIDAILKRRVKLVERIEKLIAERGEGSVLFNLDDAPVPAAAATPTPQ